jgi:general secretion pathway protein A
LENVDIAVCLNPQLTVEDLLETICDELGAPRPDRRVAASAFQDAMNLLNSTITAGKSDSLKPLLDALNAHLLRAHAAGRRTVLIIDEAQHLSREVLEQLRLLTNLETTRHKLLRIILVGQPELRDMLARADLRQLAQRITARYHLPPLTRRETSAYLRHRLHIAGGRDDLFTAGAQRTVYRYARGIPRLINVICDRALLGAYAQGAQRITPRQVRQAAREALPGKTHQWPVRPWLVVSAGLAVLLFIIDQGRWWPPVNEVAAVIPPIVVNSLPVDVPAPLQSPVTPPPRLLPQPPITQALIGPGSRGEAVRWLRQQLALAAGQPVPERLDDRFDAALAEQLRAFQREHGLRPDGLAGPRTLAALNRLAPREAP